jgi:hypothetical protein
MALTLVNKFVFYPVKFLENALMILLVDTGTIIRHTHDDFTFVPDCLNLDFPASGRILDGIAYEIVENLGYQSPISTSLSCWGKAH